MTREGILTPKRASCLFLLCVLVLDLSIKVSAQHTRVAAIIERINGTVILKQNGKQVTLNSKTDIARKLLAGDSVHCEKGATLTLRLASRVTELDENSGWFVIPQASTAQTDTRQKALDAYGRPGGRSRGPLFNPRVYSPAEDGFAAADLFALRWTPLKSGCSISFTIEDASHKELWRQANVDGAAEKLDPPDARAALKQFQDKSEVRKLILNISSTCEEADSTTFYLLSAGSEQRLKDELAVWDLESDQLFAHLGRASVFFDAKMFAQVAGEYEAALALAPNSVALISNTAGAERQAGNIRRAKEVESRLVGNQ